MTIRTSETDPLRIAELPVGGGLVGITLCPGKQGDSVFGAGWARDLASDLTAIRDWGASAVVTLIEEHEFEMLGVQTLPEAVRAAGLEWHHLPVKDVSAPSADFETRWVYAGARLRERLRAGERVLVHCRGGLGRAGSVAARLLVEFGAAPSEAIAQVRAARPGAIETREQERWVHAQRAVDSVADARSSRQLACLLGGAIGDALGYRVEFDSLAAIRRKHGEEGIRLASAGGLLEVSDDTQMSLFTLEGQLRAAQDGVPMTEPLIDAIRHAYLDWHRTQSGRWNARDRSQASGLVRHAVLWQRQAPGNTCLSALGAGGLGSVEKPINDSKGCGGVMRTAPLGFLGDAVDDATLYVLGAAAAALTHGHPDGYAPSGVMALAVRRLIDGASWDRGDRVRVARGAGAPGSERHAAVAGGRWCGVEINVGCACVGKLWPGLGRGRGARGGSARGGDGREFQ